MSLFDQAEEIEEARLKATQAKLDDQARAKARDDLDGMRKAQGKRLPSIQTSVSQVEKAEACPRKWGFEKLFRMREPGQRYGTTFGNVLHSVLERWLKADDQGRDRLTGQPVDLYPAGWQFERYGRRINPEHDQLMKDLVEQAIDQGVLRREPGRIVEGEFWGVVEKSKTKDGVDFSRLTAGADFQPMILINGKKDLETENKIGDHKSVKEMRWSKSSTELWNDLQGGVYAHQKFCLNPDLQVVEFEHYCYDWTNKKIAVKKARRPSIWVDQAGKEVKSDATADEKRAAGLTEKKFPTGITRAQAAKTWGRFRRVALDMQTLTNVQDPFLMPAARNGAGKGKDECTAFGGCGFISVCTKGSVSEFVRIRDRLALLSLPREAQEQIAEESTVKQTTTKKPAAPAAKTPLKTGLAAKAKAAAKPKAAPVEEEEEEEEQAPAPKPKAKAKPKAAPVEEEETEEEEAAEESVWGDDEAPEETEEEEEAEEEPAPKAKAKVKPKAKPAPVEEEEEETEEEASGEDETEVEGEGEERANASLLKTYRAQLETLSKAALIERILAGISGLRGQ